MHPRIAELLDYLDNQRRILRRAFDAVPSERRDVPPAAGGWSAAGIVEHVAIVNARIAMLLTSRVNEARAAGVGAETSIEPILPTLQIERVVDRSMRVQAPERLHPTGIGSERAWAALEASTVRFRESVAHADGLALGDIVYPHPMLGPLSLYQWIAFTGAHEARHAAQILDQTSPAQAPEHL